jgi:hypothetical protein
MAASCHGTWIDAVGRGHHSSGVVARPRAGDGAARSFLL